MRPSPPPIAAPSPRSYLTALRGDAHAAGRRHGGIAPVLRDRPLGGALRHRASVRLSGSAGAGDASGGRGWARIDRTRPMTPASRQEEEQTMPRVLFV